MINDYIVEDNLLDRHKKFKMIRNKIIKRCL